MASYDFGLLKKDCYFEPLNKSITKGVNMGRYFFLIFFICYGAFLSAADYAIVTIAVGDEYKEKVRLGTENKAFYCQKHGYDFIYSEELQDPSRDIYWSKIPLMQKTLENSSYKWVVWMDADTVIMNTDIPLEDLIDDKYEFIIGKDWNGINAGVFFNKNSEWSHSFLRDVYERTDCLETIWPEQIAMASELAKSKYAGGAKIVPQRLFNSYAPDIHRSSLLTGYQQGDFLIHFASVNGTNGPLAELMAKYAGMVVNDKSLITLDHFLGMYGFALSPTHSWNNEGYMSNEQKEQFKEQLAQRPSVESILEIGLNGGHSAENFIQCCPNLKKFVSFDISMHDYTPVAVEYFYRTYKEKFEFVQGDSNVTVPQYAQDFPDEKFDLIYIDGGHTYETCLNDIMNCKAFAHEGTTVWIDDYNPWGGILSAVTDLQNRGFLELVATHGSSGANGVRTWAEIRYILP